MKNKSNWVIIFLINIILTLFLIVRMIEHKENIDDLYNYSQSMFGKCAQLSVKHSQMGNTDSARYYLGQAIAFDHMQNIIHSKKY